MPSSIVIQMTIFLSLSLLFIIGSSIVGAFWSTIFSSIILKEFTLTPESKSFELWKETPFPVYMEFHMFNWTNPRDTIFAKAKPNFVQTGPYVFIEHHSKVNLTWNNDNATVTFLNRRQWHFVPELSNGSLSDNVTNLNVVGMTLATLIEKHISKKLLPIIYHFISKDEPIYITRTVEELLFKGYQDPFLTLAEKIKKYFPEINIPFDKFGWFYGRNMSDTYDGIFNMFTGADNIRNLGLLSQWNYSNDVKFYKGSCGVVNGSTGELWPVDIASKKNATIFANDICSGLTLERGSDYTSSSGLSGVEFIGGPSVFSNQSCWCVTGNCQPYGVRDISTCRFGAPVYISFPHFFQADPIYNERVSGLNPNQSLHEFTIAFDKSTGVPIEVHARLQVNVLSQPVAMLSLINQSLPEAMFPMVWFEQTAVISGELHDQLVLLNRLGSSGLPFCLTVLGLGMVFGFLGIYLAYAGSWRRHRTHQLLTTEDSLQSSEIASS